MSDTEWMDVLPNLGNPVAVLHAQRYAWAAERIKGERVANAACGTNYGKAFFEGRDVVGFDRSAEALACAARDGFLPTVQCNIEEETFAGFDALVCIETLEHLPRPWGFLRRLDASVKELAASVPIIPTRHANEYHLHDFTSAEFVMGVVDAGWRIQDMWQQCHDVLCVYAVR